MTVIIEFALADRVSSVTGVCFLLSIQFGQFFFIILQVYYTVKEPAMKELERLPTSVLFKTSFNYKFLMSLATEIVIIFPLMTIRLAKIDGLPVSSSFYEALNWNFDPN